MPNLLEDIHNYSPLAVQAFEKMGKKLDFSLESFNYLDIYFDDNTLNGQPKLGSDLSQSTGAKIFAVASYIGETLIKCCPGSVWVTNDSDPEGEVNIAVKFQNGSIVWPMQKVMKRIRNGNEDSLYAYGQLVLHNPAAKL